MAAQTGVLDLTFLSSGDMSSYQYRAVQASTTNAADGMTLLATRGGKATGINHGNSTQSEALKVRVYGVSKVAAGDSSAMENAIAVGDRVVGSSVGQAVPSTAAGQHLLGIALGALSTGSTGTIPVLLTPGAIST